jgi:hypothetical protein
MAMIVGQVGVANRSEMDVISGLPGLLSLSGLPLALSSILVSFQEFFHPQKETGITSSNARHT